ncbi:MAG: formylglycine-generating enzyme family protein [Candidatus Cloacimonetes bacterium]|nr:formylglycine-generating enzyme family protein [Candidatus Cloacimonadota bacterium]
MIHIPDGTFQMGSINYYDSAKPVHQVTVSDFYMGKYEVTQGEYQAVMGKNPSYFKNAGLNAPVEQVIWYDAVDYCNKLSEKEGLKMCYSCSGDNISCDFSANGYRLLTEAEWEYAACGRNKSKGYKYSGSNDVSQVAWYEDNSGSKTHRAGSKQANEMGIYDMSGNVCEWCWDWYGNYNSSALTDPRGEYVGSNRVYRGDGWRGDAGWCRVAFHYGSAPGYSSGSMGFRCPVGQNE